MRELPTGIVYKDNKSLLHLLLRFMYWLVASTGFLKTRYGIQSYAYIYGQFKSITEGRVRNKVCSFIKPNTLAIDVGANIGTFTRVMIDKIGSKGKVVAIEPERQNVTFLRQCFSDELECGILNVIECVVTDKIGDFFLHIDPCNPGGHSVATTGVQVKGRTIDRIVNDESLIPSFIKIDVEGHEERVFLGAKETIKNYHPIIFMEFNPILLSACDTDPLKLLQHFKENDYRFHLIEKGLELREFSTIQIIDITKKKEFVEILMI